MKTFIGIIGAISLAIFVAWLNARNNRKNRLVNAAEKFRNIIHKSLKGIYPSTESYLTTEEKDRITQSSINQINSAGSEFSHYLGFISKYRFRKALKKYCETTRKINWDEDMARKRFPNTKFKNNCITGKQFRKSVSHLLTFANEK